MQQLFGHKDCRVQNIEMEELEVVSDDMAKNLIEAVMQLHRLFTFDFSNNQLPRIMADSIVRMMKKYRELEIFCIDHCEVTD